MVKGGKRQLLFADDQQFCVQLLGFSYRFLPLSILSNDNSPHILIYDDKWYASVSLLESFGLSL